MHQKKSVLKFVLPSVIIVILISVLFASPQESYASTTLPRLAGSDRYATAVEISKAGWQQSDNVVLATGAAFPDALSAAPLSKQLNAPILLTEKASLSPVLETELNRLQAKNIYIVGGEGAISKELENGLRQKQYNVIRIFGADRYATSLAIANYMADNFQAGNEMVVATGENFPDALSIAPVAASKGMPIILTPKNTLPDGVKTYSSTHSITKTYVIGGSGVVSDNVKNQLPNAERISGIDRYETNAAILTRFSDTFKFDTTYVATGTNFPDALAGSALAATTSSPIILASPNGMGVTANTSFNKKINNIRALGGETVVTPAVLQNITVAVDFGSTYSLGNSPGNIATGGYAAGQGDYVYYYYRTNTSFPYTGAIYKMKKDGTGKVKLTDLGTDGAQSPFINVSGDWVYYRYSTLRTYDDRDTGMVTGKVNMFDGAIYKIKTDGTGKTKISDDNARNIILVGDWIYYDTSQYGSRDAKNDPGIYRIRTDGTNRTKLADFTDYGYPGQIANVDGYIYYHYENKAYRMQLDGSEKTEIIDGAFMVYGTKNWVYYSVGDFMTSGQIYKTRLNGSERTIVYDGNPTPNRINVSGDTIYFTASNGPQVPNPPGLYSIKTDGSSLTLISPGDNAYSISVVDSYLYYFPYDSSETTNLSHRAKIDGTDKTRLQ